MNIDKIEEIGRQLLIELGEDPDREGLVDTPRRWAKWWSEFIEYDPGKIDTRFESINTDQMVVIKGMKIWSLCEHHLLPFWCEISIAYIAKDYVLGLSKFARIAHKYAHRLQIQERLVDQIASDISEYTQSPNVAVLATGEHLCMTMRGIQTPHQMKSSIMRGAFLDKPEARAEFLAMLQ
jgi:GTP cyclohydrolase IA